MYIYIYVYTFIDLYGLVGGAGLRDHFSTEHGIVMHWVFNRQACCFYTCELLGLTLSYGKCPISAICDQKKLQTAFGSSILLQACTMILAEKCHLHFWSMQYERVNIQPLLRSLMLPKRWLSGQRSAFVCCWGSLGLQQGWIRLLCCQIIEICLCWCLWRMLLVETSRKNCLPTPKHAHPLHSKVPHCNFQPLV
jgi:hypothetical protein